MRCSVLVVKQMASTLGHAEDQVDPTKEIKKLGDPREDWRGGTWVYREIGVAAEPTAVSKERSAICRHG